MSELMNRIQCNPKYAKIIAGASFAVLTLVSLACLYHYFVEIVNHDFMHWQLISFVLMLASGIIGFSEFVDEDSFCPLRDLLDYCAVVLVLPCYAAEMWIKTEMGPPEISIVHAGLGFLAAIMYVILEYRRQDLTDLAIFANACSLLVIGYVGNNLLINLATIIFVAGYAYYKRIDTQYCLAPQDNFNYVLALFAFVVLASCDDDIVSGIQESTKEALKAIGMGADE